MKKSIFICCIFLLALLTQAGPAQAANSSVDAGINSTIIMIVLFVIAWICSLLFKGMKAGFNKAKEKTGESFSRAKEVFKEPELQYYGQAEKELNDGTVDQGLWAKALVSAKGNEDVRKAEYIKLRARQLQKSSE